ncbi:hypothetical protein OJ996_09015 [Luteolibacter sp. GHJ8]|uniref:Terminase n=1 Tax=Luteolibacter rhizosphaerae TaxID=2989719 RepID=A0ABT3G1L0_9BACT|nr:hypothetical protein [Luteolibacter rhizosphaerae]MCW1913713.1 hypothetical protein [Luteolibacter rhizosphaerae]
MSLYSLTPAEHAVLELGRSPYDWQIDALEAIGLQETGGKPVAVAAANGSGKTSDLVAVAVSWFLRKYPLGWVVVTSGSWNQLKNQLWPALSALRKNNKGWIVRRGSECVVTTPEGRDMKIGGAIGFSTNDPNRAEGWHPKINALTDPVFIIVDEAKGVPDDIFGAFQRCTRKFQLWTSSPGEPAGRFYEAFHKHAGLYFTLKVRSDQCPHIDPRKRDLDREELGEDSPLYRSMHLAEFTSLDNRVAITPEALIHAFLIQAHPDPSGELVGFSDFAAGGDEDTISYRHGNVVKLHDAWREANTVQSRRRHIDAYQSKLRIPAGQVWGDADGMGNVILKDMAEEKFRANEFHGGQPALDPENYANLISQVWIEGCRLIERGKLHLGPRDQFSSQLFEQLTTRRVEWDSRGRLRIESKEAMKKRGAKSPDRADSYLGAIMCGSRLSGSLTHQTVKDSAIGTSPFASDPVTGF